MSGEREDTRDAGARKTLMGAAVVSALGVAIAGTMSRNTGGVMVVAGWLMLVYALHAFGRSVDDA